jgi:pyruvate-formate lyase-activating enzyme
MSNSAPRAVVATIDGQIVDHPYLMMVVWDGDVLRQPRADELIQLPLGSDLFALPGRVPLAGDPDTGGIVAVAEDELLGTLQAVSAFVAPAYVRLAHPAYETLPGAPDLSLFAYTAIGWMNGRFYVPAVRCDADKRQDPYRFDINDVTDAVMRRRLEFPANQTIKHLQNCALEYHCRAAQNFFLDRWEAPLPAASTCNAACLGCISEQQDVNVEAAHKRLEIPSRPQDLIEVAVGHLQRVNNAVVSFGQGCEGEPLVQGPALKETVAGIRAATDRGVVNLNSNGSLPHVVAELADAGLDAIRISINSAQPTLYERYYRPVGYTLDDVLQSAIEMKRRGRFVSLNYFVFPGVSDTKAEFEALCTFIERGSVDMLQLRNLNIDPELYLNELGDGAVDTPMGVVAWIHALRRRFKRLRFGYYNPAKTKHGRRGPLPGKNLLSLHGNGAGTLGNTPSQP